MEILLEFDKEVTGEIELDLERMEATVGSCKFKGQFVMPIGTHLINGLAIKRVIKFVLI
jgi:hypothetical protein